MSTRFGGSASNNAGGYARATRRREGLPWMSNKQTEAYLVARDTLRRIQRTSPLVLPTLEKRLQLGELAEEPLVTNRTKQ